MHSERAWEAPNGTAGVTAMGMELQASLVLLHLRCTSLASAEGGEGVGGTWVVLGETWVGSGHVGKCAGLFGRL